MTRILPGSYQDPHETPPVSLVQHPSVPDPNENPFLSHDLGSGPESARKILVEKKKSLLACGCLWRTGPAGTSIDRRLRRCEIMVHVVFFVFVRCFDHLILDNNWNIFSMQVQTTNKTSSQQIPASLSCCVSTPHRNVMN